MSSRNGDLSDYKRQVGARIAQAREKAPKKVTQAELGRLLGKDVKSVSNYETGKTLPPGEVMAEIAAIFDIELAWLWDGDRTAPDTVLEKMLDNQERMLNGMGRLLEEIQLLRADLIRSTATKL